MKITFVSYIYPYPERGYNPGIERVVQEFARELVRQDHEVHVLTTFRNGGIEKYERDKGVHLHRVSDTRRYLGKAGSLFSLDLLSLNYSITAYSDLLESSDLVHTFSPIVWKSFSTPLVAHYHHWDDPSEPLEYLYLPTSHRMWLRCYDLADKVIAVSDYSAADLASRGVNRNKVKVVPNGVDTDTYYPGTSSIEFENWENILLYVGPLLERKGLKYLIQAMPGIIKEHPNTGVILVGGGENKRLSKQAKHLNVHEHVQFEGFVPENDLPSYYRAADVFVFPSLLEGFGMVLIEAMTSGLPVVSTNTTAIPEVVGEAGLLCEPSSATSISEKVNRIIDNPGLSQQLKDAGLQRVRNNFTWKVATFNLVDSYKNIIK